jgi:hypothetical protein
MANVNKPFGFRPVGKVGSNYDNQGHNAVQDLQHLRYRYLSGRFRKVVWRIPSTRNNRRSSCRRIPGLFLH